MVELYSAAAFLLALAACLAAFSKVLSNAALVLAQARRFSSLFKKILLYCAGRSHIIAAREVK
jgi:hypothetical protein